MKKLTVLLFAMAILTVAVGCGKKEETKTEAAQQQVTVAETVAPETAAVQTAAPETVAPQPVAQAPVVTAPAAGTAQTAIDAQTAKQTALQVTGVPADAASFTKVWLDYDDGMQEWEIEVVSNGTKYKVDISATDGSIRKSSAEPVEQGMAVNGGISMEDAKAAALAAAGADPNSAVFTKVKSDFDDGIQKWEIEFVAPDGKHEIELNATNGSILEMQMEMLQIAQ